jgi:IclR family pca regulon transcriptional regulator
VRDGTGAVLAAMNVTVHAAETTVATLIDNHLPKLLRTASEVSAEWTSWRARPFAEVEPDAGWPARGARRA